MDGDLETDFTSPVRLRYTAKWGGGSVDSSLNYRLVHTWE